MDVFEAIDQRYSYRGEFTDAPVSRENLTKIAQAGIQAATACNEQIATFVIVDDPDRARELFHVNGYTHNENEMLGVEMNSEEDLPAVLAALLEAEVNIHFLYPFLSRPNGRCGLALFVDDRELAEDSLALRGMTVIDQNDISR